MHENWRNQNWRNIWIYIPAKLTTSIYSLAGLMHTFYHGRILLSSDINFLYATKGQVRSGELNWILVSLKIEYLSGTTGNELTEKLMLDLNLTLDKCIELTKSWKIIKTQVSKIQAKSRQIDKLNILTRIGITVSWKEKVFKGWVIFCALLVLLSGLWIPLSSFSFC